jgi:serine/threonine protein kinase
VIADRFEPLGPVSLGLPVRARDLATAQTVILRDAGNMDRRLVGIFHPALLAVFAIVDHKGQALAATEFVQARSLTELFADVPCHSRRAAEIVSELADGVAELHSRDICHGGIGPDSAMLTAKGKAKLGLTTAVGGTEEADLKALKLLLCTIGGQLTPAAAGARSAATFAALLRMPG